MKQKVIQIGNSLGLIIPSDTVKKLKLKKGEDVDVLFGENNVVAEPPVEYKTSESNTMDNDKFMQSLERVNKRYDKAFKELADK